MLALKKTSLDLDIVKTESNKNFVIIDCFEEHAVVESNDTLLHRTQFDLNRQVSYLLADKGYYVE